MTIPEGWTDDMSVKIKEGKSEDQLTLALMDCLRKRDSFDEMVSICTSNYDLADDEANLAIDRVQGGIVRALSCRIDNRPDVTKDPLAYIAFNEVWKTMQKKNWWSSERDNNGEWLEWHTQKSNS